MRRIAKSVRPDIRIGTTFSCTHVEPWSPFYPADLVAANKVDALLNRVFIEPLLGLGYPVKDLQILRRLEPFMKAGDECKLAFYMDFIGLQNYTREIVCHSYFTPYMRARIMKASERKVERTLLNWEVYPVSIYHCLKKFSLYGNIREIIITENGAAFQDKVENGKVDDAERKQYLEKYLYNVLKAKNEGVNVTGYFVWSFTDNFEWAEGYYPRFGLVYVDFATQRRIIKSSGRWYSRFLSNLAETSELLVGEGAYT